MTSKIDSIQLDLKRRVFVFFNGHFKEYTIYYIQNGYRMMAVTNPALCRRTALRYTAVIGGLSLAAPYFDVTNIWFALETLPLNEYFGYLAWRFYKNSDSGTSRKLFPFSLLHLPVLMILFLINKKRWIFIEDAGMAMMADESGIVSVAGNETIEMTSFALN